ncbi:NRDE family protein [Reinekea sp.]|jgi:uncharacterized protein with NRDE domain|uniref:NRDE family protein n=1 Tax=Reinekea sp. TaxID=1970455 RepID=UPI0039893F90
MCLAVIAWYPDTETPLTVVANRDEFRARPTQAMHWWPENILAGKDLQAGGTWLGFNKQQRFALLTNIRPGYIGVTRPKSRGDLVTQFLTSELGIAEFQNKVATCIDQYAGFNLILGDGKQLFWLSSNEPEGKQLSPGIYGLSNDALDTAWPKVTLAKQQLNLQLSLVQSSLTEHKVLQSTDLAKPELLPDTGLSPEWESMLSAQCIAGEQYGTRCRSHFVQNMQGEFWVCEEQINQQGMVTDSEQWRF